VRPARLLGQRADALSRFVLLPQVCRELLARGAGYPAALLQSLGHPCLLIGSALRTLMITPIRFPGHPFARLRTTSGPPRGAAGGAAGGSLKTARPAEPRKRLVRAVPGRETAGRGRRQGGSCRHAAGTRRPHSDERSPLGRMR